MIPGRNAFGQSRLWLALVAILPTVIALTGWVAADEPTEVEKRLAACAGYLASDALEGRGAGTQGLDRAADYIVEQFQALRMEGRRAGRFAVSDIPRRIERQTRSHQSPHLP